MDFNQTGREDEEWAQEEIRSLGSLNLPKSCWAKHVVSLTTETPPPLGDLLKRWQNYNMTFQRCHILKKNNQWSVKQATELSEAERDLRRVFSNRPGHEEIQRMWSRLYREGTRMKTRAECWHYSSVWWVHISNIFWRSCTLCPAG